jgi:hypothetical protein
MRWAAHVAGMATKQNTYRVLVRKSEQQRQLGRHGEDSRIMIKGIFQKRDGRELD